MKSKGPWVQTYTGKKFYFLDPQPEDICIEDISHHLSQICRYTGATKEHYSVAEHSVLVSYLSPMGFKLYGLLHDFQEAYIGDLNSPLKSILPEYCKIEENIIKVGFNKFGLNESIPFDVLHIDKVVTHYLEKPVVFYGSVSGWEEKPKINRELKDKLYEYTVSFLESKIAEQLFLDRFYELTK